MVRKLLLILLILLVALGGYFSYQFWLRGGGSDEVTVIIPEGSSFSQILDSLESSEVIDSRSAFRLLSIATGNDGKIKPGRYKFQRGIAHAKLLEALVEGRSTVKMRVTFPEGITIRRMASIASQKIGVDSAEFVHLASDREFLKKIGINAATAEGYLMPDTYFLFYGEQPEVVLEKMSNLFREFYTDELKNKAAAQKLTPYEVVILASIVEGEARVDEERPTIAGLYLNRLRIGMELKADPTIQYILPDGPRRLFNRDLEIDSPYNTYRNKGLPPTPINNPSRASINAVLNPESHDYLFMVAKADGSGRHTFTKTGAEHERAVQEYRRRVREGA
jgi:UPF0755 protein